MYINEIYQISKKLWIISINNNEKNTLLLIEPSNRKNKKYDAYELVIDNKNYYGEYMFSFGDKRYQHYKDILGYYKTLDHGNIKRLDNYYKRHGEFPEDKITAKTLSHLVLWPKQ